MNLHCTFSVIGEPICEESKLEVHVKTAPLLSRVAGADWETSTVPEETISSSVILPVVTAIIGCVPVWLVSQVKLTLCPIKMVAFAGSDVKKAPVFPNIGSYKMHKL